MPETDAPAVVPIEASPTRYARWAAEVAGTFVLVFGVIGTAIFAAGFAAGKGGFNVGFLGVALALGLSVLVSAYAFGPISGGHFNPAVTIGLATAGRFDWKDVIGYVVAQLVGGILASTLLLAILAGSKAFSVLWFRGASTGWGVLSPGGYSLLSVLLIEVIATAILVYVILGVTSSRGAVGFAPLAIGFTLTLLALIAIPVSNGSFNPARSIATAIYGGPDAISQVWLTIIAPIVGALIAGSTFRFLFDRTNKLASA
ncbi:aquaporin Z [Glaciibacter flavus]|uniref:Aquaporin Z n=1 Tax=Orlajensenia flava TaxID=2565934 RepID=A0A4S4FYK2_9MICO|nr:aquaporin [Glaciibacter flavus]THG35704.1 aquaporin Z [Glaciibacter flavus]